MDLIRKILPFGGGVVGNYDHINFSFNVESWKVNSAVHKSTGDRVSLWMIDRELLDKNIQNKEEQEKYLQGCLTGLQNLKKYRHPHLLKILEVQEKTSDLAFAAEPISSCLSTLIGSLNNVDSSYLGYQIANVMDFLHTKAKLAHLGLCPDSILLDENLSIKLFKFNWCTQIEGADSVKDPYARYEDNSTCPSLCYSPPEMVMSRPLSSKSDVFSFALIFLEMLQGKPLLTYKKKNEYDIGRNPVNSISGLPQDIHNLFFECMQPNANQRPDFSSILTHPAFNTTQMKIMKYLEMIITKDPKDKFNFYKNLIGTIDQFSPLLIRCCILPILVDECKTDIRFAPVLLRSIFAGAANFTTSDFTNFVFKKIAFLTAVTDPPQVSIALLQNLPMILNKTEARFHNESVYPIIFQALTSNQEILQTECLKKLPLVVEMIDEKSVNDELLPKLVVVAQGTKESSIAGSAIGCIAVCLKKSDNATFLGRHMPKVYEVWKKNQSSAVAVGMLEIIEKLNAPPSLLLSRALPVAADVSTNRAAEAYVQKRLCNWMMSTITAYKIASKLDEAKDPVETLPIMKVEKPTPKADKEAIKDFEMSLTPSKPQSSADIAFTTPQKTPSSTGFDPSPAFGAFDLSPAKTPSGGFGDVKPVSGGFDTFDPSPKPKQNPVPVFDAFDPSPKPKPNPTASFDAFEPSPKPKAPSSGSFDAFNSPKPPSNAPVGGFNAFNSPKPQEPAFSPFGQQQSGSAAFPPFGSPQQSPGFVSSGRPLRTTGGAPFGQPQPQQQPQQSAPKNDVFDLF